MSVKKMEMENLPTREPIRMTYDQIDARNANDNRYKNLKRYIKGCIGQKWDVVYSNALNKFKREFNSSHDLNSCINFIVDLNCTKVDKDGIFDSRGERLSNYRHSNVLYVDQTGILKLLPGPKSYKREKRKSKIVRFNNKKYFKFDDIWYEVTTVNLVELREKIKVFIAGFQCTYWSYGYDIFLGRIYSNNYYTCCNYYGEPVLCKEKRQINKREKRALLKWINKNDV